MHLIRGCASHNRILGLSLRFAHQRRRALATPHHGISASGAAGGKCRTGLGFRLIPVLIAMALAWMPGQLRAQSFPELTEARAVRALTSDQARQARPVRLRGVVTVLSGWKSSFFFQDATAGISVDRSSDAPKVEAGQLVEIEGTTAPGLFAPLVNATRVTVLGKGKMPLARLAGFDELAHGKLDSQWIAIRGVVRSAIVRPSWGRRVLFLEVDIGDGNRVIVRIHDFPETGLEWLPDSTVSVRGVCGTIFNNKRQFVGLRLFATNLGDVQAERPAPADPFNIPLRTLGNLLQFGDQGGIGNPVKMLGIVTYSDSEHGLYIQEGSEGVLVQPRIANSVALGSQVEAVGYPAEGRYSARLEDALVRVVGVAQSPAPVTKTASDMIVVNDGFPGAPFDSVLVRLQGVLIEEVPGSEEDVFLLRDGDSVFTARLPVSESAGPAGLALREGSLLSVTGICVAKADNAREARSFEILLRSAADVAVLKEASWWTASRSRMALGLLVFVLLFMAGWMALLRRQARLRALALTDDLTGLYNRRGFLLIAEHQWKLALRKNASALLFYIDVDEFKKINDLLGHKEGDRALQTVATALRDCFRKTDLIGRLGGDEFSVIAIEADPRSQAELERRLDEVVQESNRKAGRKFQLSLSIGVLACDNSLESSTLEELLARTDALMYEKKREHASGQSKSSASPTLQ